MYAIETTLSDTTSEKSRNNCQYSQELWTGQPGHRAQTTIHHHKQTITASYQTHIQGFFPCILLRLWLKIAPFSSAADQENELMVYMGKYRKFSNKQVKVILNLYTKWQFYQLPCY